MKILGINQWDIYQQKQPIYNNGNFSINENVGYMSMRQQSTGTSNKYDFQWKCGVKSIGYKLMR